MQKNDSCLPGGGKMKQWIACCVAAVAAVASGGLRTNDYSWVRGTHYYPTNDAAVIARELGYGKRVGLNTIRFRMQMEDWRKDPNGYTEKIRTFVRRVWASGYWSVPFIFNGNHSKPEMFEEAAWTECAAYATDLVTALKDEPGLLMWDVMNEPVQNPWIYREKDKKERQRRRERVWAFTRRACALVRRLDPCTPLTLGHTRAWEIEPTAEIVDVISFHDYEPTRAKMEYNFNLAESLGKKYGKPVINSEMGCLARANPYDMVLEECQRRRMGWIIYGHMIRRRSDNMHGVFYTDGTVRDPATVAAMMGCFRCRDTSVIIPGLVNREGSARKAVDRLRRALAGVKPENSFTWRFASTRELLEASEHAANLLECCDLVPMAIPPTARIAAWRKMENPPWTDIRIFAYDLAKRLEKACELSQQEEEK